MEPYYLIATIVGIASVIVAAAIVSKDRYLEMPVKIFLTCCSCFIGVIWPLLLIVTPVVLVAWGLIKLFEWVRNNR